MALCGNCGAAAPRVKTIFTKNGILLPIPKDECPVCAPQSFEPAPDPSTRKIWIGPEYMPSRYRKKTDHLGDYYEGTDELRADTEDAISRGATDETEKLERMKAQKRLNRRTAPLKSGSVEHFQAINRAREVAKNLEDTHKQYYDQMKEAEAEQARQFAHSRLPLVRVN
jgi:hypothetical protein